MRQQRNIFWKFLWETVIRPRCWIEMNFKWESLKKWVARESLYLLVNYKLIVIIIILERKEVSIHRLASLVGFVNFALISRTLELDLTEFFRFFVSGKIISIKSSLLFCLVKRECRKKGVSTVIFLHYRLFSAVWVSI